MDDTLELDYAYEQGYNDGFTSRGYDNPYIEGSRRADYYSEGYETGAIEFAAAVVNVDAWEDRDA